MKCNCAVVLSCKCSWQVILIISTAQYSTRVGNVRGFPSFVCRTAGYKSICIRKVLRPTDRPAGHLHTCFLASSVLQTNAVTVPKIPNCCCMLLMHPSRFQCIKMSLFKVHKLLLQIRNQFRSPLLIIPTSSFSFYYQKDERPKPGTKWPCDAGFRCHLCPAFSFLLLVRCISRPSSSCVKVNTEV